MIFYFAFYLISNNDLKNNNNINIDKILNIQIIF